MFTNQSRHDGYDPAAFSRGARWTSAASAIVLAILLFNAASAAILA